MHYDNYFLFDEETCFLIFITLLICEKDNDWGMNYCQNIFIEEEDYLIMFYYRLFLLYIYLVVVCTEAIFLHRSFNFIHIIHIMAQNIDSNHSM